MGPIISALSSLNWSEIVLVAVAVDTALIAVFPNAGVLKAIGNFLAGLQKPAA